VAGAGRHPGLVHLRTVQRRDRGRAAEPLGRQIELGGPQAEALAFAADRMDHLVSEVEPALARGETIVADRYYLSSLAYQALSCDLAWLREINRSRFGRT